MYDYFQRDFPRRTRENLELVEQHCAEHNTADLPGYEVTQLLNSLLGMLVFLEPQGLGAHAIAVRGMAHPQLCG